MEETKTQENEKLQSALQEMHIQFKETKAMLEKEREVARTAEKVPIIQEIAVVDHEMLEKLNSENEKLKVRRPKMSLPSARTCVHIYIFRTYFKLCANLFAVILFCKI